LLGEIPISAVIWEWERNDAIPPSGFTPFCRTRMYITFLCLRSFKASLSFSVCFAWRNDHGVQWIIYTLHPWSWTEDGQHRARWSLPRWLLGFLWLYVSSGGIFLYLINTYKLQKFKPSPILLHLHCHHFHNLPPMCPLHIACIITTHSTLPFRPPPISPHLTTISSTRHPLTPMFTAILYSRTSDQEAESCMQQPIPPPAYTALNSYKPPTI
jgi:hypothetical protein